MYDGVELEIMRLFNIQAYATFKDCFTDLREGKRDTEQVSEEQAKEFQEIYDKEEYQQAHANHLLAKVPEWSS